MEGEKSGRSLGGKHKVVFDWLAGGPPQSAEKSSMNCFLPSSRLINEAWNEAFPIGGGRNGSVKMLWPRVLWQEGNDSLVLVFIVIMSPLFSLEHFLRTL